jgi:hypothetical protein
MLDNNEGNPIVNLNTFSTGEFHRFSWPDGTVKALDKEVESFISVMLYE